MTPSINESQTLVDEARRLRRAGQGDVAEQKLRTAAQAQNIDAMIELAHVARGAGKKDESDQWIDAAESALRPGDLNGHISLNGAYSLGLGRGERDVIEKRALHHLKQVALAGNSVAQERLAFEFLDGTNGCERSVEKFEYWIRLAIETGSSRAVYIYVEHLFRKKSRVPPELLAKLHAARGENKAVEKLIKAISTASGYQV